MDQRNDAKDNNGLPIPPLPPAGLPSDLIERRPDVKQAEAQLEAATESIGVAKAAQFPTLRLTGSFGVQSKTKGAVRMTSAYKIDGTPAMAVHGRYTVPSSDAMLGTVNQLVGQVRKQQK
jgi:outer membrane protein TolC